MTQSNGYRVGQRVTLNRIGDAVIRRVHDFGTVDVESTATGRWYRVTGLPIAPADSWGSAVLRAGAL